MNISSNEHHYPNNNGSNGFSGNPPYSGRTEGTYDDEQEIDLFQLFNTLLRNKWTLLAFLILFSGIAAVMAINQTPIYESEGTIIISESKNRYSYAGSDLSNLLTTTYGIGVGSTIANELQILKSRSLSSELADSLLKREFTKSGKKFPLLWKSYPEDSSTALHEIVAGRIRNTLSASQVTREADIVSLSFQSPSPEEAAYMVNLTMTTYSRLSTEQNRTMAESALSFLSAERNRIQQQLEATEQELQGFMDETHLVAVSPQTQELITTLSTLEGRKQEIEVQLVAVTSAIQQYESQLDEIKPGLAEQYSESVAPILINYQFLLRETSTELLQLYTNNPELRKQPEHPEVRKLINKIDNIKAEIKKKANQLIQNNSDVYLSFLNMESGGVTSKIIETTQRLTELKVEKAQFETQQKVLNERVSSLNARFDNLPKDIIQLSRLKRDVKINEELFLLVSNQYAEMSLWEKTQFGLGRPLDFAVVPKQPVKPQKRLWVLIGFLIGGVLGVGFIFIKESLDDTIKSSEALKEFHVPFLGNVPDFELIGDLDPKEKQMVNNKLVSNQLLTFLDHISPISEAYRRLRINIIYANPDKNYKVLMVTSSTKGEGKSTIAANLGVTFAEAGKKALIIDLDLRRPTMHKIFGENKEPGLVELLFQKAGFDEAIKSTIAPNVDLITVGQKTPEPASVLDSKRLKDSIDHLKDHYDHIILDTAPYGIISDSASLLRLIDGMVLVTRFNTTTKRELDFTIDGLKHLNAEIVGTVLNAFDPKKSTDYYTNYYYYKRAYSEYYEEKNS
ncbi:MAG: polysaccharide biosynthesis tyrosine autokinase [Balneolaceae bacterium]|nr:polysaccharide biosynthesis tyrosine autokinase [Balneolaceae bacterium]